MEYNNLNKIYRTDFLDLYHCDCMELLRQTPDNYYSLALVDPPYGIGFANKIREAKTKNWDNSIPTDEYFSELKRVSKNQIIWGANYFPYLWQNGCKGFVFWNKDVNFDSYSAGELAYTSFDKPAKYYYYAWNGLADGIRGRNKQQKTIHPTEKPIQLYEWLIKGYTDKDCKILDTHFGSGSIALAVDKANRLDKMNLHLTACEIDKEYIDKAIKRISESIKQGTLSF